MERITRRPYKPKLRFDKTQRYHIIRRRVAGKSYRSERLILEALEYAYREPIKRKRRVIYRERVLYQVMFKSGLTVECAFMEVGIKGYYVRYTKVKPMKWRNKKKGYREPYTGPR